MHKYNIISKISFMISKNGLWIIVTTDSFAQGSPAMISVWSVLLDCQVFSLPLFSWLYIKLYTIFYFKIISYKKTQYASKQAYIMNSLEVNQNRTILSKPIKNLKVFIFVGKRWIFLLYEKKFVKFEPNLPLSLNIQELLLKIEK